MTNFNKILNQLANSANQSYIIVVDNNSSAEKFIVGLKHKLGILTSDYLLIKNGPKDSIKISEVKQIKTKLALKPQGEQNLVCIVNSENLTLAAANSFLKILEEPPKHSLILLFTNNIKQLLATIISRCVKIIIHDKQSKAINSEYIQILTEVLKSDKIYQKFNIVKEIIDSEIDIRQLLTNWLIYLRQDMNSKNKALSKMIYKYSQQYSVSINKKLFLENLVLDIIG